MMVVALLVVQPDFGQTMLIALVWSALFFMAGMRVVWVFGIAGLAGVGLLSAYYTVPHVARRIQRFLDPASGDTFNIDIATESFMRGGWFGKGPGEGTVKRLLPESHTDFVFAVAAEEFGIVLCLVLVALFAFIVIRMLLRAMRNDDPFTRFAAAGLTILFAHAIGDQHGGELASDPGQGHDAAVHFLWRLLDDLARLCDGHAAGADARAAARGDDPARSCGGREQRLDAASGAPLVLLAAGGTGGHLFPAEALAIALDKRGITVDLATDHRAAHYTVSRARRCISSRAQHCVAAIRYALAPHGVVAGARHAPRHGCCSAASSPRAVVGFGGYPTVPPLLAASWRGIPTVLHEQNGVMGRANRLLAPRVTAIATGFRTLKNLDPHWQGKITLHRQSGARRRSSRPATSPYGAAGDGTFVCWCSVAARARA